VRPMRPWVAALGAVLLFACARGAAPAAGDWATAVVADGTSFTLEIADTDEEKALGYMGREVGPREGMLFVYDAPGLHSFWMKNCVVPLDLVWLDPGFRVVDVTHAATPCPPGDPCPAILPTRPAQYVLELAAGTARAHGLRRGERVDVLRPDGRPW
jgi:uncharacterized membrane protein (UPF0127 family)